MTFGVPTSHANTLAQWMYDATPLAEFSGSGAPNLEVANGIAHSCEVAPGILGLAFVGATGLRLRTTAHHAALDVTTISALTIEMLVRPFQAMTLGHLWTLITHAGAGSENKLTNAHWGLRMRYSTAPHQLSWFQESGSGTDAEFVASTFTLAPGCLAYLVGRRHAAVTNDGGITYTQRVELIANGKTIHDSTPTVGAGTNTDTGRRVYVGKDENDSSTTQFVGAMALVRVTGRAITDGEVETATGLALGSFATRVTR